MMFSVTLIEIGVRAKNSIAFVMEEVKNRGHFENFVVQELDDFKIAFPSIIVYSRKEMRATRHSDFLYFLQNNYTYYVSVNHNTEFHRVQNDLLYIKHPQITTCERN